MTRLLRKALDALPWRRNARIQAAFRAAMLRERAQRTVAAAQAARASAGRS